MIGKSLANDFQYTKLKYKHLYFILHLFLLFLQFIYQSLFLFCFFKLLFNLVHFYLMYYQGNNIEYHQVNYPPYEKLPDFWKKNRKQNKQKYC